MGLSWAEHTVEIDAPIELAFAAIVDYETFPGWQNAVEKVDVIDRTADGLGRTVRLYVDAKVRKIDYVLRYGYEPPTRIVWDFVEGNGMRDADGDYVLESLGPSRTRATYRFGADPQIPAPGIIIRRTHKQLVKRSVEDLKREAERRAAAGEAPAGPDTAAEAPAEAVGGATGVGAAADAGPAPGPEPAPAAPDWVPLAARREASEAGGGRRGDGRGGAAVHGAEELVAKATEAAGEAARMGRRVAKRVLRAGAHAGRGVAERVERELGDDEERRDR